MVKKNSMYLSKESVRNIEKNMGNKQIHLRRLYNKVVLQRRHNNKVRLNAKISRSLKAGANKLPKSFIITLGETSYTITHELASGVSGQVFKGTYKVKENDEEVEKDVVIKKMPKKRSSFNPKKAFEREVRTLETVASYEGPTDKIIQLLASHEDESHYYLVFPFLENEDLFDIVSQDKADAMQKLKMMCQVVEALHFLHTINIAHLDLKLENVFVDKDFNIKLGDFGFAEIIRDKDQFESFQGTLGYLSPEIYFTTFNKQLKKDSKIPFPPWIVQECQNNLSLYEGKYSAKKADAWALGIMFCILLFEVNVLPPNLYVTQQKRVVGLHPHFVGVMQLLKKPDKEDFFKYLNKSNIDTCISKLESTLQEKCKQWIRNLLQFEPSKRMTLAELYEETKILNL